MPAPDTDRTVADAIDRVLDAERATAAALVAAGSAARATIDAAREERRRILERARARITRLHERASAQLAQRLAQLDRELAAEERAATPAPAATRAVLDTVAARLTRAAPP